MLVRLMDEAEVGDLGKVRSIRIERGVAELQGRGALERE